MTQDKRTALIHHPYQPPPGFESVQPAVHRASTVIFPDVAALRARDWRHKTGYTYGLHGTPTSFILEERIATLEHGLHCALVPSGLAAITLVNMTMLKQGDELLLPNNVYGPSREQARHELARWGIAHRLYDPMDPASLERAFSDKVRLVWIEAPGSITMEFPDIAALAAIARRHGALSALDNTWGAGLAFNGFDQGVDIVMQALTKYPSGGADVLMGSVVTRDPELHGRIKMTDMRLGMGIAGNDAEVLLRSLPSLATRYAAHDVAGRDLAAWLGQQSQVRQVLHPALAGSPGHEHWARTCSAAAGLFSVLLDERFGAQQVDDFCNRLKLFRLGFSWAGPVSLVVPYDLATLRGAASSRPDALRGHLVRFSIGLEAVDDLRADLQQALTAALGSE